ncbi:C2H2 type zinc-finger-domain-containing protein [Podospora didyma]|uniref:C2H2 type zinc-finger-domain-containing protein n=1 Tax=Podospora didyma TaxID=330526 RepID=A0AAE0P7Q2_9PEZI|nr:C2H2 type zinc-finger-domain-containing protein [Podospora didyma]
MATISGNRAAQGSEPTTKDITASHPYTCNTCQVAFRNNDLQKGHMRSDWHRYNLKRRVASLPPISSETFSEKVLQARALSSAQADKVGFEKTCDVCEKSYFTDGAYRNHIGSAKHKANVAAARSRPSQKANDETSSQMSSTFSLGEPADNSEVDSEAEEEFNEVVEGLKKTGLQDRKSPLKRPSNPHLSAAANHKEDHPVSSEASESATPVPAKEEAAGPSLRQCLFCNYESPTPALSALHMERIHGMFIPEKTYLVDLEGLIGALHERVFILNECLSCGKVKSNAFAVQTHMRDKSHCQIPFTTEDEQLEIGEFYDFRCTYSDDESSEDESEDEEMEDGKASGGAKLGAKRSAKVTGDGDEVMNEDGWETDSSASSLDSDDLHAVPAELHDHQYARLDKHPHHSREGHRTHRQRDGFHAHSHKRAHAVFYDEYELHLPSGKSVGHRSLNKYYRQNLHNYPTPAERAEREERLAIEAAEREENGMDVDSDDGRQLTRRDGAAHGRVVMNRNLRGLGVSNVTDPNMREVKNVIMRGLKKETHGQRRGHEAHSKRYFKEVHRNPVSYLR